MKRITIDGKNITSLENFYNEIERTFTKDLSWEIGRNLDAFNDVLNGGFGVYELNENIELIWINYSISVNNIGVDVIKRITKIIHEHQHINFKLVQ